MFYRVLLLILILSTVIFAEEDGVDLRDFDLQQATLKSELVIEGEIVHLNGHLFTGIAYSVYSESHPSTICQYREGLKNGYELNYYPDGSMELEASYSNGMLNGRFRGWDESGELLYDLWFDNGMMKRDLMLDNRMDDLIDQEDDAIDADGKDMKED